MDLMGDEARVLDARRTGGTGGQERQAPAAGESSAARGQDPAVAQLSARGAALLRKGDLDGAEPVLRAATDRKSVV